jgi:hypothetical protein
VSAAQRILFVSLAHDVVAVEDGSRPVSADLHRHTLRNASTHHVPNCRAPEVMEQFSNQAGARASGRPSFAEIYDRIPVVVENIGGHLFTARSFHRPDFASAGNELAHVRQLAIAIDQRHATTLAVFRMLGPEAKYISFDICPQQGRDLPFPPSRDVPEADKILQVIRQCIHNDIEVRVLEKALPRIPLWQVANDGSRF